MSERRRTRSVSSASDRRPAIWPWFAMPAAALALFWTLHTVRHTGTTHTHSVTREPASGAAPAQ